MDILTILTMLGNHAWIALILILAAYVRKLVSTESQFPVNLTPSARTLIAGAAGAVIACATAREAGQAWLASGLIGFAALVASSFFDGLLTAIFGSVANAPSWAKALVFIVDDIGGGGGTSQTPYRTNQNVQATPSKPPSAASRLGVGATRGAAFGGMIMALFALFMWGCPAAVPAVDCVGRVTADALKGMTVAEIVADVAQPCALDAAQVISILAASKDAKVMDSAAGQEIRRIKVILDSKPAAQLDLERLQHNVDLANEITRIAGAR